MWLRDALPLDLPTARILIYGYDTQTIGSNSFQNLDDLGRALQADIGAMRVSRNRAFPSMCPVLSHVRFRSRIINGPCSFLGIVWAVW